MIENSVYHSLLRVSAVVCTCVLVFVSGLIDDSTAKLADDTQLYLANAVGASASVEPTELNKYTAALTQKQRELEERESALREREIAVELSTGGTAQGSDTSTYVLASILFLLLVLILLNYALDYLRQKEPVATTV
tara:strand:+ start:689 stop:1096 length:408 start_codon:yes stop_codon:yes gene_type:complete